MEVVRMESVAVARVMRVRLESNGFVCLFL